MANFTLSIRRYNPETQEGPHWQNFKVDLAPENSVLDALLATRNEVDGTLGFKCSCQGAICGSCGMRVNGDARLACNTLLKDMAESSKANDGVITVEPLGNMPVVKDLIVDRDAVHWKKIQQVKPWLLPEGEPPEREYRVPRENMADVIQTMACIQCSCCVSECLSLEVDPLFIGPAALAKAYRFVGDPRDSRHRQRLEELAQDPHGLYDCTHCFRCVEACPKSVAPMDQIMRLRRKAIHDFDITDPNNGRRHEEAFVDIIRKKGQLDESKVLRDSFRKTDLKPLLQGLPTALKALRRGKTTLHKTIPGLGHSIPGKENLGRIYDHAEEHAEQLNLYIVGEEVEEVEEGTAEAPSTEAEASEPATMGSDTK